MKNVIYAIGLLSFLLVFSMNSIQAQKTSFEGVTKIKLKSSGPIINNGIVQGYYFFYMLDKIDKKTRAYQLDILDQNLERISRKKITGSKYFTLVEGVYNGNSIMLKFHDIKEGKFEFRIYDKNSEQKSKKVIDVEKGQMASLTKGSDGEIVGNYLFSVPNKGFVHFLPVKNKKLGFTVKYFPEDGEKGWKYSTDPKSKTHIMGEFLGADGDILLVNVLTKEGRDIRHSVMGIDLHTGKKLFETSMDDKKYPSQVINSFMDPDTKESIIFGLYYKAGDDIYKDKSIGLFSAVLEKDGKIKSRKLVSWDKDVSKHLPINKKGKIDSEGYLYFHKIIKAANGKILAVGEQYKTAADAMGIASAMLGGGQSLSKMVIENLYVFEFNPDFSLNDVQTFEKSKTNVSIPGIPVNGAQKMALYINYIGGFDYEYTQKNHDNSILTIGYVDFEKRKGEKNKSIFGSITYADGEFTTDKIELETDATSLAVYPAKPGYVMISEYFKKSKKVTLRLEKFNY
jgi:Family of unknown function (DUF6770)